MSSVEEADVVIALFDGSMAFGAEDQQIVAILKSQNDKECIVAINKSDLPRALETTALDIFDPIEISAKHQFQNLTKALKLRLDGIGQSDDLMLISARQIEAVEHSFGEIDQAQMPLEQGELEFFSYHLQEAIKHLSSITRPYNNEEILDKMFGEFCLGK
jgi:tRNA modification GTPase